MDTPDRPLFEASFGSNPKSDHDDPDMVEIVPGVWMHKQRLETKEGRFWAKFFTENYQQRLNMPRVCIEPEMWQVEIKLDGGRGSMQVKFDAQMMIADVARVVGMMIGHQLGRDAAGGAPNAPKQVVESARRVLKQKLRRELQEFLATFKEDVIYVVFMDVGGEVKRMPGGKRSLQQQLREKRVKRAEEKYKSHPGTESSFPTAGHLRVALKEALKAITTQKSGEKVTASDVVEFFSNHPNYPSCGSEGTFRYWLRRHKLPRWTKLREELLANIK